MKKFILMLMTVCTVFTAIAQKDIVVDPNASARTLTGQFETIKVSGGIDLYISQSDKIAAAVSASAENYKEEIKTVIENGTLKIFFDGSKGWTKKDRKLRVYVSFTDLKKLEASGACDVFVTGSISTTTLVLQMSGACDFKGSVKLNTLDINLSGASDARISGTAGSVNIKSTGASDVKGYDLITEFCNANASGASDIHITVNKELNATANGASDIKYKGTAVIKEKHINGASSIVKVN